MQGRAILLTLCFLFAGQAFGQPFLYRIDSWLQDLYRYDLDGTVRQLLWYSLRDPYGLAVDEVNNHLYWIDALAKKIQRADLDGSNVRDLIVGEIFDPRHLALDVAGGKMYWTDQQTDKIQRANLDGSQIENLVTTGLTTPVGIAVDPGGGKMYWTDRGTDLIQRANLNGSNVEVLVTGLDGLDLALDLGAGKLYVANHVGKIQRFNLDGTGGEDLLTGLSSRTALALDVPQGWLYFADNGIIKRANLDGTNPVTLATGNSGYVYGLALHLGNGTIYWSDYIGQVIERAKVNGTGVSIIAEQAGTPLHLLVDVETEKLYWSVRGKILRADFDGTNRTVFLTPSDPRGLAVDHANGKFYWANGTIISRANLDGTGTEPFISNSASHQPDDIAVDPVRGKIYWSDLVTDKIERINIDQTNREVIVTGLNNPRGISLDIDGGKLYWAVGTKIQRANLDGSQVETLVGGVSGVFDVTVDAGAEKLYWSESSTGTYRRANLDGTGAETLFTAPLLGITALGLDPSTPLPVEFVSFEAAVSEEGVDLRWSTASETQNAGFAVEMQEAEKTQGPVWRRLVFVPGAGTTTEAQTYTYRAADPAPGFYRFRLKQIDYDGRFRYSRQIEVRVAAPASFIVGQVYPNPFSTSATFRLAIAHPQQVVVTLYDMTGRKVRDLYQGFLEADETHAFPVEAKGLTSGFYMIRIQGETFRESQRVVVVR